MAVDGGLHARIKPEVHVTSKDFLTELGKIVDSPVELKGEELLSSLPGWDSMANITFIAMADADLGLSVSAEDVANARTVQDLKNLVDASLSD